MGEAACRKCGDHAIQKRYDGSVDVIRRRCLGCGYDWTELPRDRQRVRAERRVEERWRAAR